VSLGDFFVAVAAALGKFVYLKIMNPYFDIASWNRTLIGLVRVFRLVAAVAISLVLSSGAGQAEGLLKGELYAVGARESDGFEQVEFNYQGDNFKVARSWNSHNLRTTGDVNALLNDLRGHLDGDKANSKRRDSKKRSGYRSAQSKAVWNMGSQDKRSRN